MMLGGVFLIALLVTLTVKPNLSKRMTAIAGVVALIGGLLVYGYGYIATSNNFMLTAVHAVFAVCRMFIGEEDYSSVSEAPAYAHFWMECLFWVIHLLAFYATSSAAISLIGASMLQNLRVRFAARQDLNILYGVHEDSVGFGKDLASDGRGHVIFVDPEGESTYSEAITEFGGVLRVDRRAVSGNLSFLKSLGLRKGTRQVTVYALHTDYAANLRYATDILSAFSQRGLEVSQISLVIHAREDDAVKRLQVSKEHYGYGFVTVFQEHELTARLLTCKYPPCERMEFDENGVAQGDFEVLVIGFGKLGQAVLRSLVMNGQFVGSNFRADIFAPDHKQVSGYFLNSCPEVLKQYNIVFHDHDGRSEALYEHLSTHLTSLRYIALCTGSEELNREIEEELRDFLSRKGVHIPIHQCSRRGIQTVDPQTVETVGHALYNPDVLDVNKIDAIAMLVNQVYQGDNSKGALADWMDCDYFSRMSCRAFADFTPAVLRAAGKGQEEAIQGQWSFSETHLENLSRMEHDRWCAFHYCMGFSPMSDEEYARRTDVYLQQKRAQQPLIRVGKNMAGRTHACLIPWEALDDLSQRETKLTGKAVDHKQSDTNNILILPQLLASGRK